MILFKRVQISVAFFLFLSCESQISTTYSLIDTTETLVTVDSTLSAISIFKNAYDNQHSNIQVKQVGTIQSVLTDDTEGTKHQRVIVRLSNAQTLLIAHNIDLAPRVPAPLKGKSLKFYGEYEWNSEGGVIHWTHKDPAGIHIWLVGI